MISAKQAQALASGNTGVVEKSILEDIEREIISATNRGEFETTYDFMFTGDPKENYTIKRRIELVVNELRSQGYKVGVVWYGCRGLYLGTGLKISW